MDLTATTTESRLRARTGLFGNSGGENGFHAGCLLALKTALLLPFQRTAKKHKRNKAKTQVVLILYLNGNGRLFSALIP